MRPAKNKYPASLRINQSIDICQPLNRDMEGAGSMPGYTSYWKTSAEATPLKGGSYVLAYQEAFRNGYTFKIRDRIDKTVTKDMFIKFRGGRLQIISSVPDLVHKKIWVITALWSEEPERSADDNTNNGFTYTFDFKLS